MSTVVSSKKVGGSWLGNRARLVFCAMLAALVFSALMMAGCGGDDGKDDNPSSVTYKVTFNANGGSGTVPSITVNAGSSITLPSGSSLTKSGYDFDGWNTKNDGTGTDYSAGSSYTPSGNVTLYAKWNAVSSPTTYTVTFNSNGGSGTAPSAQIVDSGSTVTLPNQGSLTKSDYEFDGWNTKNDGTGTNYSVWASYTPSGNVTLYAKWVQQSVTPSGGTFTDSRDGKTYKKVTIGSQVWMAENLNYDVSNDSTDVCYKNSADSCARYGRLYNWATAMSLPSICGYLTCFGRINAKHQGVCPAGWHVPTYADWDTLVNSVGGNNVAGRKLKAQEGWDECGPSGSGKSYVCEDAFGFAALPGGSGDGRDGSFFQAGYYGHWWIATEDTKESSEKAYLSCMYYYYERADRAAANTKIHLYSVRCIQD